MSTVNPLDPYGGTTPPIEQMLGSAYDNVRRVAQNINVIQAVDANKENIDKAAQLSDDVLTLKEEMEAAVSTSEAAAQSATESAAVAKASELSAKQDAASANQSAQSASQSADTATSLVGSVKKAILYYDTFTEAQAAATTLPDGQTVDVDSENKRYKVLSGALVFFENIDQLRQDLSGVNGAGLVGYTPAGTGAVASTVQNKLLEYVSFTDYTGFIGDGINDDKAAVEAAAAYCISSGKGLYCPPGYKVKLSGSVNLKGIRNVCIESDIVISSGMLTVGGNVNAGKFTISLQDVTNGTSTVTVAPPASPVVRVTGVSNSEITIGACNYIQLYANAAVSNERYVSYNQFRLTGSVSLLEITDSGTAQSYVNENAIYADRVVRYRVIGVGYAHNHNKLFHPCLEGSSVEIMFSGSNVSANQVYGARFEGTAAAPGVTFGAGTYSNTVIGTWSGVGTPRSQFIVPVPVSDSGAGNMVTTEAAFQFRKTSLFSVGPASQLLSTATDTVAADPRIVPVNAGVNNFTVKAVLTPSLNGFHCPSTFRWIALTEPIPVQLGDVIGFDADFDGSLVRTSIFVLDADMKPLTDNSGGEFINQTGTAFSGTYGSYSPGSNLSAAIIRSNTAAITRPEVKFVRVGVALGLAGFVRFLSAHIYTQALQRGRTEGAEAFTALRSLNGTPTKGYAPQNTLVWDHTAGVMRRCTFQYENTLNGALAAGDTSVTVTTISTVAVGDICGILLDNGETHWSAVSALTGSTFTISAIPAGRSAPNGGRIVFNRWA